jgi:hypothetical protein
MGEGEYMVRNGRSISKIKRLLKYGYDMDFERDVLIIRPSVSGRTFRPITGVEMGESGFKPGLGSE